MKNAGAVIAVLGFIRCFGGEFIGFLGLIGVATFIIGAIGHFVGAKSQARSRACEDPNGNQASANDSGRRSSIHPPAGEMALIHPYSRGRRPLMHHWISTKTANLDQLRASAAHAIELLKVRRAALIAAAVTVNIAVPTHPASVKTGAPYEN